MTLLSNKMKTRWGLEWMDYGVAPEDIDHLHGP